MGFQMAGKSRKTIAQKSPSQRSAVANGTRLFIDRVDGRTAAARRFRDILAEMLVDLGGSDRLSEIQRQLVRRFASLSVEAEILEMSIAQGKPLDLQAYSVIVSALSRLASLLGLERRMKEVQPIDNYLEQMGDKQ